MGAWQRHFGQERLNGDGAEDCDQLQLHETTEVNGIVGLLEDRAEKESCRFCPNHRCNQG